MMDNKSRMSREAHVRFCEKLGLKCPCLLDYSAPANMGSTKVVGENTNQGKTKDDEVKNLFMKLYPDRKIVQINPLPINSQEWTDAEFTIARTVIIRPWI